VQKGSPRLFWPLDRLASFLALLDARCATERQGRTFAKHLAVFQREPAKLCKAETRCNLSNGDDSIVRRYQRLSHPEQSQHSQMAARRHTVGDPECFTKCSFAYREHVAQRCDIKRLVKIGESQPLGLLHEVKAGLLSPLAGPFSNVLAPSVDVHQSAPGLSIRCRAEGKCTTAFAGGILALRETSGTARSFDLYRSYARIILFDASNTVSRSNWIRSSPKMLVKAIATRSRMPKPQAINKCSQHSELRGARICRFVGSLRRLVSPTSWGAA